MAVASFLKSLRARNVKTVLDSVYATEDSALNPALVRSQIEALDTEEW
jgi:hypothetical protein